MKKVIPGILSVLLAVAFVLSSCGGTNPGIDDDESTLNPAFQTEPLNANSGTYVVSNVEMLRQLVPEESTALVILRGYYEAGDGGGGTFYYDIASRAEVDNGIVFDGAARGRFVRSCLIDDLNVKWFGAKGNGADDDAPAIQAAIDALPLRGGTVHVPGGTYNIGSTINIGDGDAHEKVSTRGGVKLIGEGGGLAFSLQASTEFNAVNQMENMVSVNGRISDVEISGIYFGGNGKVDNCLFLHSFCGGYFHNLTLIGFKKIGLKIMGGGQPVGNYNTYNRFESIAAYCLYNESTALLLDGDADNGNDTWISVFTDCRFDTAQSENSYAGHFRFVDSISFYRCHFNTYKESSVGAVFDATSKPYFPCGMGFYDCSVTSTKVIEDEHHQIRPQYFYGFGTEDGEKIPTDSRLRGITDHGETFNMDDIDVFRARNARGDDGGDGFDLIAKGGRSYTYGFTFSGDEEVKTHYNLKKQTVATLINAKGTLTSLVIYASSYSNDIGSITASVYRWDTDYETTLKGAVLAKDTVTDFPDNTYQTFEFSGLGDGYYLIVLTGESPASDFGVACWTKNSCGYAVTFVDGVEASGGLWGEFITE